MLDNVLDIETMETDLELRDVLRYSYRKEWEETLLTQIQFFNGIHVKRNGAETRRFFYAVTHVLGYMAFLK